MPFALKRTDTEWLSSLKIGRKTASFSWEKNPAKALVFDFSTTAQRLCDLVNCYAHEPRHGVFEVTEAQARSAR